MTLAASGNMSIGTNLFGPTRCIRYEILGSYGAYSLSQANAATGQGLAISDYYSYTFDATPADPSNFLAVYNVTKNWINLTWDDNSSNEDNFRIEVSHNGGGYTWFADPAANDVSDIYAPVTAGDNYRFRIRAESAADGDSGWVISNLETIPI